jgi:hypothetical protein
MCQFSQQSWSNDVFLLVYLHVVPKTLRYVKYECSFHSNMLLCQDLNHQFLLQGPDGIPIEVWRCLGARAIVWLTKLFNLIFWSNKMPEE